MTSSTTTVATAPEAVATGPRPQRSTPPLRRTVPLRTRWQRDRSLVVMTLPALLLLGVFAYVPMAGNIVAWQDYSPYVGIAESPFVAWDNFARVLGSPAFLHAVRNTLVITGFQLVFYFPIPIALALLLNSVLTPAIRTTIQSIVYLPHFFSWVLVITVFHQIFGGAGLIAQLVRENEWGNGFDLMTDPGFFKWLVTAQVIWKDAGWGIIVFLAALSMINNELYESAAVDGANRWRRMWHVTLPGLRPVIALLLVLQVGNMLTLGMEQFLIQRNAVGPGASEVLDSYVWDRGIANGDFSYAAAIGIVKGVFSLLLVLAANRVAHAMGEQGIYKRQ